MRTSDLSVSPSESSAAVTAKAGGRRDALAIFLLALLLFNVVPSLNYALHGARNGFVWDDDETIVKNSRLLHLQNLRLLFRHDYFETFQEATYRPAVTLTYFADALFWGKRPAGYHLTNFILHLGVTCLIYALARQSGLGVWPAWFGAAFFAVLPVHAEAVSCVSLREDLLAALFALLSFTLYVRARTKGSLAGQIAPAACFGAALFSKESTLMLPLMLVAYEVFFPRRERSRLAGAVRRGVPFAAVLAAFCIVRFWLMKSGVGVPLRPWKAWTAAISFPGIWLLYMVRMLLPLHLRLEYEIAPGRPLAPATLLCTLLLVLALVGVVALWRRHRRACFWMVWFFIFLGPVSNLWPLYNEVALRYVYLPSAGVCLGVSLLLLHPRRGWQGGRAKLLHVLLAAVLLFNLAAATHYTSLWKDARTLWAYHVQQFPRSEEVRRNLGLGYQQAGQAARDPAFFAKAEHQYKLAFALNPDNVLIHDNLGYLYSLMGNYRGTAEQYEHMILRTFPLAVVPDAYNNLAKAVEQLGDTHLAERLFAFIIQRSPRSMDAFVNFTQLLLTQGRLSEAADLARRAHDLDPYFLRPYVQMAQIMIRSGEPGHLDAAEEALRQALRIAPKSPEVFSRLIGLLNARQRYEEARDRALEATRLPARNISPLGRARMYLHLARSYGGLNQQDRALKAVAESTRLAPDSVEICMKAGLALADLNAYDKAIEQFHAALKLQDDLFDAQRMIAQCYEDLQRPELALDAYRQCLLMAPDEQGRAEIERRIQQLSTRGSNQDTDPPGEQAPDAH